MKKKKVEVLKEVLGYRVEMSDEVKEKLLEQVSPEYLNKIMTIAAQSMIDSMIKNSSHKLKRPKLKHVKP